MPDSLSDLKTSATAHAATSSFRNEEKPSIERSFYRSSKPDDSRYFAPVIYRSTFASVPRMSLRSMIMSTSPCCIMNSAV